MYLLPIPLPHKFWNKYPKKRKFVYHFHQVHNGQKNVSSFPTFSKCTQVSYLNCPTHSEIDCRKNKLNIVRWYSGKKLFKIRGTTPTPTLIFPKLIYTHVPLFNQMANIHVPLVAENNNNCDNKSETFTTLLILDWHSHMSQK